MAFSLVMISSSFFPKTPLGTNTYNFNLFSSQGLPILAFIVSFFAGSFTTTKFFNNGPVGIIPKNAPLGGLASINFIAVFSMGAMHLVRLVSIESIFFSYYLHYNYTVSLEPLPSSMLPILDIEMRLPMYFAPVILSSLANIACMITSGNLRETVKVVRSYPQLLLVPGFTPFIYKWENDKGDDSDVQSFKLTISMQASFANALSIGCLPPVALLILTLVKKQINEFVPYYDGGTINDATNTLFPWKYGAMIFAISSCMVCLVIIVLAFKSHLLCYKCGMYCAVKNITFCPFPHPYLVPMPYIEPTTTTPMPLDDGSETEEPNHDVENAIFTYRGHKKSFLHSKEPPPLPATSPPSEAVGDLEVAQVQLFTNLDICDSIISNIFNLTAHLCLKFMLFLFSFRRPAQIIVKGMQPCRQAVAFWCLQMFVITLQRILCAGQYQGWTARLLLITQFPMSTMNLHICNFCLL